MKKLILVLIAIVFVQISYAQDGKPEFQFDKETFDFGQLTEGEAPTHEFKFKNTGTAPLKIAKVTIGCDNCATLKWSEGTIQPGGSGQITVTYYTEGRPLPFLKTIIIFSNARQHQKVLYIKGRVVPEK